jgi:hypothetical protein
MDSPTLYDDDILEWSQQQAAALRHLARIQPGISNEVDWENVAEEIECVGRSELATVRTLLRKILIHLIKALSAPEGTAVLHGRKEAAAFHDDLLDRISRSMLQRIDADDLWTRAMNSAEADLADQQQPLRPSLPKGCPIALVDIAAPEFDFAKSVAILRQRAED